MTNARSTLILLSILVATIVSAHVVHGCSTALLVIDMQNYVFNPLSPFYTVTDGDLITAVQELLILARAAGLPIIYIRHVADASPLIDPERLAVVDELAPQDGDAMFTKTGVSAFDSDELEAHLKAQGIRRLVLSGLSSQGAIQSTLFAGIRAGYEMLVVQDAHSSGKHVLETKRFNNTWRGRGIAIEMMDDIDWAAFRCGGRS